LVLEAALELLGGEGAVKLKLGFFKIIEKKLGRREGQGLLIARGTYDPPLTSKSGGGKQLLDDQRERKERILE